MDSRSAHSLIAAERVRQIAVDHAKRSLSEAIYLRQAMRRNVDALDARSIALGTYELGILQAPGALDIGALSVARRYRSWVRGELDTATKSLEGAERAEADARAALAAAVRARDAVRHLQTRRRLEECACAARREQHALDDQGAVRAAAARISSGFHLGGHHGS
jgi:hypothetical protein